MCDFVDESPIMQGTDADKAADYANYFCSYSYLYHQKQVRNLPLCISLPCAHFLSLRCSWTITACELTTLRSWPTGACSREK